jgi:hypothetical protein
MDTISNCVFCDLARSVITSSFADTSSSIQSSPHWLQTQAGTLRTTITPVVKSTSQWLFEVLPSCQTKQFNDLSGLNLTFIDRISLQITKIK